MEIYSPSEDSFFFRDFLLDYFSKTKRDLSYLDVGSGSGILPDLAGKFLPAGNIAVSDINPDAVAPLGKKYKVVQSNLFENILGKFDLITFNAPYLPEDEREPKESQVATTGGKRGDEISVRFISQAKKHLNKGGKIFLLVSSLTPSGRIKKLGGKIVARKKIFVEELRIFEFSNFEFSNSRRKV